MILLVFGPTAVGKTQFLHKELASQLPAPIEIINTDSVQVYKHLNIGSAKPSAAEQKELPYWLLDVLHPEEQFNIATFLKLCDAKIDEILARGHIPVLSGGTAFYFKHFLYGIADIPPIPQQIVEELETEMSADPEALYQELCQKDSIRAQEVHPHDHYRIVRALSVIRYTHKPFSSFKIPTQWRAELSGAKQPFLIGLQRDRKELYRRIDERVSQMFAHGLEQEIAYLFSIGINHKSPGVRSIGYKEFFDPQYASLDALSRLQLIQKNSRNYAKRQLTFFRAFEQTHWLDLGSQDSFSLANTKMLKDSLNFNSQKI